MNFSSEWDQRYREGTHMSRWPWSDLVSYVYRYVKPKSGIKVLELGCGAGANVPFFKALGASYCGIDGSETIVADLRKRFPEFAGTLACGDFTVALPFEPGFDLVVDRSSLTCNTTSAIRSGLALAHKMLKPGGKFVGIDWFSTKHSDFAKGSEGGDRNTRKNFKDGQFADTGLVHFSDKAHLQDLFRDFELMVLEHKESQFMLPDDSFHWAGWNLLAARK